MLFNNTEKTNVYTFNNFTNLEIIKRDLLNTLQRFNGIHLNDKVLSLLEYEGQLYSGYYSKPSINNRIKNGHCEKVVDKILDQILMSVLLPQDTYVTINLINYADHIFVELDLNELTTVNRLTFTFGDPTELDCYIPELNMPSIIYIDKYQPPEYQPPKRQTLQELQPGQQFTIPVDQVSNRVWTLDTKDTVVYTQDAKMQDKVYWQCSYMNKLIKKPVKRYLDITTIVKEV